MRLFTIKVDGKDDDQADITGYISIDSVFKGDDLDLSFATQAKLDESDDNYSYLLAFIHKEDANQARIKMHDLTVRLSPVRLEYTVEPMNFTQLQLTNHAKYNCERLSIHSEEVKSSSFDDF